MTADEFFNLEDRYSESDRACELVRGQVVEVPLSDKRHGLVCANLAAILGNFAQSRASGFVCSNGSGLLVERNPDTVLGPDISYFDEDATAFHDQYADRFAESPPILTAEVLSIDDRCGPCLRRVKMFLDFGVAVVLLVDIVERFVLVQERCKEFRIVGGNEVLSGIDVLPGFSCSVADLFSLPGR